jgi:hypothetical protein
VLAVVLLCSGCDARITDGTAATRADADPGSDPGPGPNPRPDAGTDAAIDAAPVAICSSRSVYLNFDGQVLTRGRSDATLNQAEWMQIDIGRAPPYLDGNAGRATTIQAIVAGVRAQLAQFPITVTTTRPSAGNYVMIVYGGTAGNVGSLFGGAVNRLDCDDSRPNDVAWVSDLVSQPQLAVNVTIGAIGFGLGLTATLSSTDCMCSWDNSCRYAAGACTLGSPITRDPNANQQCLGAAALQDEVAAFRTAFCR